MLSESQVRDALLACYDTHNPYSRPVNVVDLGLIESVELTPDLDAPGADIPGVPRKYRLTLTLVPSSSDEDAQTQLAAQITNRMAGLPEISGTRVFFAATPAWTPARITPEGRTRLKLDAAHFSILNNR